ncbi:hypothetical protein F0562_022083 [Nyssa sinensis]|uniref:Uncharacterized protein n=1 Tax=Nyssa sinensis TaxID=561372 RepID=A0A5J5BNL4_9ASTE|nr:hypothetical protein F0562_022083 [Nyssa sinensis]
MATSIARRHNQWKGGCLSSKRPLSYPWECDGACLQMRLSYSPAVHIFFLCSGLIGSFPCPEIASRFYFIW